MRSLAQQLLRRQVPAPPFSRPPLPCPAVEEAAPPLPSVLAPFAPFAPPLPPLFARPPQPVPGHLLQALRSSASCPSSSGPSTRSPRGPDAAMLSHRTPKETQVFEFSLCLSQACLGIVFMYKWRKNFTFLYRRVLPRADPGELAA